MLEANGQRLRISVEQLATFSQRGPNGAVTRLPWTTEDRAAVQWLDQQLKDLGCQTEIDSIGNLWGKWDIGASSSIVIGSHRDSVPLGGAYDGALGVLGALETVRILKAAGYRPQHNIEVVAWNDEEGARFGTTIFGSRLYVGALTPQSVAGLQDAEGLTLGAAAQNFGYSVESMRAAQDLNRIRAYFELHIEQGPILEREQQAIGIVEGVGAILQVRVDLRGVRLHAAYSGIDRRDPVFTAGQALRELERLVSAANKDLHNAVIGATVGTIWPSSNLINVVPESFSFTIDLRGPDPVVANHVLSEFESALQQISEKNHTEWTVSWINDHTTFSGGGTREKVIAFNDDLKTIIKDVARDLHYSTRSMYSWAGHDAMAMAPRVPTAMIFVPSSKGLSHTSAEYTLEDDLTRGANVLVNALIGADQERQIIHDWVGPILEAGVGEGHS